MGYSIFDDTMVDMTWPKIEAAAEKGAIVLLPTGIIEEHGPHMGLAVDTYAAYIISVKAKHLLESRGIDTLIAPPQYWGVSAGTSVFPGTFSVRPETMQAVIYDILASLKSWSFNRVFIINWHADIEHCRAILAALQDARRETNVDAVCLVSEFDIRRLRLTGEEDYILKYPQPPMMGISDKYVDIHAGSMETAVMMKYFPKHVKAAMARKLPPTRVTLEDLRILGKNEEATRKLIPDGYFGNPAGYDTAAAEKMVTDDANAVADYIEAYLKLK
ncbi:MAG: creatininase family protein [Dehalococcoidales bacterium]|nr:creatininase family protein [Dehalococcoidales bacterium]